MEHPRHGVPPVREFQQAQPTVPGGPDPVDPEHHAVSRVGVALVDLPQGRPLTTAGQLVTVPVHQA